MGSYLRLGDLGRPLQDDLGEDILKKKKVTLLKNGEEKEFQTEEMAVPGIAGYWKNNKEAVQWDTGCQLQAMVKSLDLQ